MLNANQIAIFETINDTMIAAAEGNATAYIVSTDDGDSIIDAVLNMVSDVVSLPVPVTFDSANRYFVIRFDNESDTITISPF